jgi:hypothetical protein
MKQSWKNQVGTLSILFLAHFAWSQGPSTDCAKLSEDLCSAVKAKSSSDTVYVSFYLKVDFLSQPDSCKSIDLRTHPDSNCNPKIDSAAWAKLKQETEEVYAKFSAKMKDVLHPSQSIPYPGDSTGSFKGVIVTTTDLITIAQDTNILEAEPYFNKVPVSIKLPGTISNSGIQYDNWLNYSVNGKLIPRVEKEKSITVKMRK